MLVTCGVRTLFMATFRLCTTQLMLFLVEAIHDMRTPLPFLYPCREDEPQNPRHRPRSRNLHLRHLEYAAYARYRDDTKPRRSVAISQAHLTANRQPGPISHHCTLPVIGQLLPRISVPCPLTYIPSRPAIRTTFIGYTSRPTDRRRLAILYPLADSSECHPSAQGPDLLPRDKLNRHAARNRLRQGYRHPRMEHSRRGEIVSVPQGFPRGTNILDELQPCLNSPCGQFSARYGAYIQARAAAEEQREQFEDAFKPVRVGG